MCTIDQDAFPEKSILQLGPQKLTPWTYRDTIFGDFVFPYIQQDQAFLTS